MPDDTSTPSSAPSLADRLRQRTPVESSELLDVSETEDLGPLGWLRGVRERATMLELRLRSGNSVAVNYAYLERAEYDPSEGITLHLAGHKPVRLLGRRLNDELRPQVRLFEGIVRHRVAWVREGSLGDSLDAAESSVVTRIEC